MANVRDLSIYPQTVLRILPLKLSWRSSQWMDALIPFCAFSWRCTSLTFFQKIRGVAVSAVFDFGESGHLRPLAATCSYPCPAATCGHLRPNILGRPLAATCGHLRPLAATHTYSPERPLAATCGHSSGCKWLLFQIQRSRVLHPQCKYKILKCTEHACQEIKAVKEAESETSAPCAKILPHPGCWWWRSWSRLRERVTGSSIVYNNYKPQIDQTD